MKKLVLFSIIIIPNLIYAQKISGYFGPGSYIKVNDVELYYEIHGQGEPILFLHGGSLHSESYSKQVEFFKERFKIILLDTRGHGRSKGNDTEFNYHTLADDVYEVIVGLNLDNVTIIGHSDGGIIGYILAYKHPGKVKKLITIGANYSVGAYTDEAAKFFLNITPELMEENWQLKTTYEKLNPHAENYELWINSLKRMWTSHYEIYDEDIKNIISTTLVIVGDNDWFAKLEHFIKLYNLLPKGQLMVFPNAGHTFFMNDPDLFNRTVFDFISEN